MPEKEHYFSKFPDVNLKQYTVSESLRRHLYIFKTVTGVFSFKKLDLGTKVLIENMRIPQGPSVLIDLGCGYGPIGIVLAYESPQSIVYLIEINKRAIWCTKENIKINLSNYKKRVFALEGNYFEPFNDKEIKFDGIYMNPPLRLGKKPFLELCKKVSDYLKKEGFFQFVIRKKMGAQSIYDSLIKLGLEKQVEIIYKRSGYWIFNLS